MPEGVLTEGTLSCDGRLCTVEEKSLLTGRVFETFSFEQKMGRKAFVEEGGRGYRLWIGKDHLSFCTDCALKNRVTFPFLWYRRSSGEKLKARMISGQSFLYSLYNHCLRWLGYVSAGVFIVADALYKAGAMKHPRG